jgi:hypothetical protein
VVEWRKLVDELVRGLLQFSPCELVSEAQGQFGTPKEGKHLLLPDKRLVKTQQAKET